MYLSACGGKSASSFLPANATKLIIELLIQKADPSNWAYKTEGEKKKDLKMVLASEQQIARISLTFEKKNLSHYIGPQSGSAEWMALGVSLFKKTKTKS